MIGEAEKKDFGTYLRLKDNRFYIVSTVFVVVVYFLFLRWLYPVPSFFADSFTFVGAAITNQTVTFRPILYSKILQIFRYWSSSTGPVVFAQFFLTILVNLFLFFTTSWFFKWKKWQKAVLYFLLILHPFYLFYSNYISSDAFFNCFAVLWFTLLLWIIVKPSGYLVLAQIILLALLFQLRYNAIYFPIIAAIAIILSPTTWKWKLLSIAGNIIVVVGLILFTSYTTGKRAGTYAFSPFGGWQMANNAMHVMRYEDIDTAIIKDAQVKELVCYSKKFFDTTREVIPEKATAWYMWYSESPLKKYMDVYPKKSKFYFRTWAALGPIYGKFGQTVIFQKPGTYLQKFVLPNSIEYFLPELEIYETYMEDKREIAAVAVKYYKLPNKTPHHYRSAYAVVFHHWKWVFLAENILFLLLGTMFLVLKRYKTEPKQYNHFLLCFALFFLANACFVTFLAPSVLRYHIFIMALAFPVLMYLIRVLFGSRNATS